MGLTDRAMLRLHIEAVWGVKLSPLEQNENTLVSASTQPDWRLYAADLAEGRVLVWRADVRSEEREKLRARLAGAWSLPEDALQAAGVEREIAFRLSTEPRIDLAEARHLTRRLTQDDYELIESFWPGEAERVLREEQPLLGVIAAERLLSLAHSARRTAEACELGIDTERDVRRKGYALASTVAWTAAIIEEGLTPIYSAHSWNTASLHLAVAAGYREFARAALLN
ncbi:MAG TPA: GNAT family N-acetyltransferase [Ktedonobacteraceae bacterium]